MVDVDGLCREALRARQSSYAPYSRFHVGAALLDEDGKVWKGCNVENCSYGGAICAERTALCKAVSEGCRRFVAIAVCGALAALDAETDASGSANASGRDVFVWPCGICRQFMAEFNVDMLVASVLVPPVVAPANNYDSCLIKYETCKLSELLPRAFTPQALLSPADGC